MKLMTNNKTANLKKIHMCINFKHTLCIAIASLTILGAGPRAKADGNSVDRKPAAVEEEVLTVPLSYNDSFFTNEAMFAEDDAGVMRDMKESLRSWEATEEYARVWDLESTGLYTTPTASQKGQFIAKKMLRYADKRLSGEMKKADEGSTLHRMSAVEKQLRPNASVNMNKYFSLKFKARVLQGKAIVELKNPWVDCNATVTANGRAVVATRKEFKSIGLASGAEYSVSNSQFLTYVDQQVTDNVKARLSNTSGNDADSRLEMMASFPFNL